MLKKCKVVMLPTNQKAIAPIILGVNFKVNVPGFFRGTGFHLYITSLEVIKEGDYFLGLGDGELFVHQRIKVGGYPPRVYEEDRKIIATTNPKLELPEPSQKFIKKFVESYNSDNIITECVVEFEPIGKMKSSVLEIPITEILKVNPKDNTITIKKVKDSWTREEHIKQLKQIVSEAISYPEHFVTGICFDNTLFNNWIDKNL